MLVGKRALLSLLFYTIREFMSAFKHLTTKRKALPRHANYKFYQGLWGHFIYTNPLDALDLVRFIHCIKRDKGWIGSKNSWHHMWWYTRVYWNMAPKITWELDNASNFTFIVTLFLTLFFTKIQSFIRVKIFFSVKCLLIVFFFCFSDRIFLYDPGMS